MKKNKKNVIVCISCFLTIMLISCITLTYGSRSDVLNEFVPSKNLYDLRDKYGSALTAELSDNEGDESSTTWPKTFPEYTYNSLTVHPTDPNTIMVGSWSKGVFKTIDGGISWKTKNRGFRKDPSGNYPEIIDMIFDIFDPRIVYAATTSGPALVSKSSASGGFYYSSDSGDTWIRSMKGLHNSGVISVAQDRSNPDILYLGLDNGNSSYNASINNSGPNIYKSIDGGLTWTGLNLPVRDNRIYHILVDPTDSNIVYCCGLKEYYHGKINAKHLGFAKSTDGGKTWRRINNGISSFQARYISMDPNNPSILYGTSWGSECAQTYRSINGGETWISFPQSWGLGQGVANIRVSPFDSNILVATTWNKVLHSNDTGDTWSMSYDRSVFGISFENIEFSNDKKIVYGSAEGLKIYKSTNGGVSFFILKQNLADPSGIERFGIYAAL